MDAAARAELEALRRRAFGPDADIHDDPAALARLIELEDLARPGRAERPSPKPRPAASEPPREVAPAAATTRTRRPRHSALPPRDCGCCAGPSSPAPPRRRSIVTALVLAQPLSAPMPAGGRRHPPPMSPVRVHRGPALRDADDDPARRSVRRLHRTADARSHRLPSPRRQSSSGSRFLGDYYGWDLWIAGWPGRVGGRALHRDPARRPDAGPMRRRGGPEHGDPPRLGRRSGHLARGAAPRGRR